MNGTDTEDPLARSYHSGMQSSLPDSSPVARRICGFRGHFVASPEYIAAHGASATPAELLEHEALMQGTETWRMMQDGKLKHIHPRGRFKADNGASRLAAALAGIGIAALPDFMVDSHIASGALRPLLTEFRPPEAGMYVVRPPASHPTRKVRVLTDILVGTLRRRPKTVGAMEFAALLITFESGIRNRCTLSTRRSRRNCRVRCRVCLAAKAGRDRQDAGQKMQRRRQHAAALRVMEFERPAVRRCAPRAHRS